MAGFDRAVVAKIVSSSLFYASVLSLCIGCGSRRAGSSENPDQARSDANGSCGYELCDLDMFSTISSNSPRSGTFVEGTSSACPFPDEQVPPLTQVIDEDKKIPEFRRNRSRRTNMNSGTAFLQDHQLHEYLQRMQGQLFDCLDLAACYSEDLISTGEMDFQFELEPNGRVSAVSVEPSAELDQPVVRACARRSVYETQFPAWRGARMVVSYRVEIDEGEY